MSVAAWLGALSGLTLLAIVAGSVVGFNFVSTVKDGLRGLGTPGPADPTFHKAGGKGLRELVPIITNLANPDTVWVRLQAAIVFDRISSEPDAYAAEIGADILAYLRTLSIDEIRGASGLQHLREDLNERAAIRSGGHVRELIIQTLVVQ